MFVEVAYHVVLLVPLYFVMALPIALVVAAIYGFRYGPDAIVICFVRIVGSVLVLVFASAIGQALWALLAWKKLYESMDPVVTFVPFLPFGQWVLDFEWGGRPGSLLGNATMLQVKALWWSIATLVWSSWFWTCRQLGLFPIMNDDYGNAWGIEN